MKSFAELNLSSELSKAITDLGYEIPSPIQVQALPILLGEPTDFIGLAATGTGKTAAFGIPLLEQIELDKKCVQSLIMCPTRELALQVTGQINLLGKYKNIRALPIYGGANYPDQMRGLRSGHQIVVGTPGRIVDHLTRGTLDMQNVKTIVLDEADKMISMGFKEDLEAILQSTNREASHIWLYSATMDNDVRRVADTYLRRPKFVQVNRKEMLSTTVEQFYYPSRESDKPEILCKLIEAAEDFYGLVFCQTKSLVVDLSQYLVTRGYKVDSLHGDKTQMERERTMRAFRDKKVSLLVCTDVASRGLDVKDVTHVINYSIPRELEVYVHRIGRTARSGKAGIAMSLVTPSHRGLIGRIEQLTKTRMKEGRIPSRREIGVKKVAKMLEPFQAQKNFSRAVELLGPEWKTAIAGMVPEEIVGRFLSVMSPEVFENQEKGKPLQAPVLMDSRGNAVPGGGRRDERHKGPKEFREGRKDFRSDAPKDGTRHDFKKDGKPTVGKTASVGKPTPDGKFASGGKRLLAGNRKQRRAHLTDSRRDAGNSGVDSRSGVKYGGSKPAKEESNHYHDRIRPRRKPDANKSW